MAASWTGDTLADVLKQRIAVMGRPAASLKDGGSERHKAISVGDAQGLSRPAIDALAHAVATMRKRRSHDHPKGSTWGSACAASRVSSNPPFWPASRPPPSTPKPGL